MFDLTKTTAIAVLATAMIAGAPFHTPAEAHDYEVGDLVIDHPWSRATPAGARVGAGYMVIRNTGDTADRLVSGETDVAGRIEIHEMAMNDGVMTMREIAGGLEIPAGGEVVLEPGGYHMMFMGLEQGFVEGEAFDATLVFETAGPVEVEFAIEGMGARSADHGSMDHGSMDHGSMDHGAKSE